MLVKRLLRRRMKKVKDELVVLREERKKIDAEIKKLELDEKKSEMKEELEKKYAKIVCVYCEGTGLIVQEGNDTISNPPEGVSCNTCNGLGYIVMRKFDGKRKKHGLIYDERF